MQHRKKSQQVYFASSNRWSKKRMKRQEKDFSRHNIRQCLVNENKVLEWDILLDKMPMKAS